MNFSLSASGAMAFALVSLALAGCAQDDTRGSDVESTTASQTTGAHCVSVAAARAAYDQRIQAENTKLQAAYDAALAQDKKDIHDAEVVRDQKLAALPEDPSSDASGNTLNAIINEYNAAVAPGGPIEQAYNARIAAAKASWDRGVAAARDAYYASLC
jgi:hypothetical protein